jgi:hypothetical protein
LDACDRASSAIQPNSRKTIKYNNRRAILRSCWNRATDHSETQISPCDTIFGTHTILHRRRAAQKNTRVSAAS